MPIIGDIDAGAVFNQIALIKILYLKFLTSDGSIFHGIGKLKADSKVYKVMFHDFLLILIFTRSKRAV